MSPLFITSLVIGGVVLLLAIAYINQMVEANKIEKARMRADLTDRLRRCGDLNETLPGQLMSPALKQLLIRLQIHICDRLIGLNKNDKDALANLEVLRQQQKLGESITISNPQEHISSEAKGKDIRYQLETLHGQLTRAVKDGVITVAEGKHWVGQIRHMLCQVHIELFNNLGLQALQKNMPGQARLAFERGVQYLSKQPEPNPYKEALKKFEDQLARANALVLDNIKRSSSQQSELNTGLDSLGSDEEWKKKNIYD
ncbi:hypothetical protein WG219_12185 [Ectopseudomonas mendocina]|uniref:DNA repair protein n=1 Tax=Ectopseudomonas mendocina TaxID=300 RepID=A0ABZ2RB01_ECTME